MSELILRRVQQRDHAALCQLWCECFDDSEAFIRQFFAALDAIGGGVVAEADGKIVGAAYALTALKMLFSDGNAKRVGYIYGVGVYPAYRSRGVGRAVTCAAAELAHALGADIIATLPAEDSLYAWYEELLSARYRLYRRKYLLDCAPASTAVVSPLCAQEYLAKREELLRGVSHLCVEPAAMDFEAALVREYGGGLYRTGGALAAAYVEGRCAIVRELICADVDESFSVARAVGSYLGTDSVALWSPSTDGESYILSDAALPKNCVWNISFD